MSESNGEITQARPYQDELLNKAIERNTIVYLPTGTGKTYIAVMLVKELSGCTEKSYSNGGKRSIFLAPNVPLVTQQAEYFRRHTSLKVECYYGEKRINDKVIDLWDEKIWNRELENNQLLVMTPKILLDMVAHSFINLNRINLVIFDECHRAVGLHDYSQILRFCRDFDPTGVSIRILGLTACVVQTKCNLDDFNAQFKKLEDNFNCKIETILVESDEVGINTTALFKKPQIKMLTHKNDENSNSQIVERLNEVISKLKELEKKYEKSFVEKEISSIAIKRQTDNIYKYLKKEFTDLLIVLNELGLFCFKEAFKSFKESINLKLSILTLEDNELAVVQKLVDSLKEAFDFLLNHYLPDHEENEKEIIFKNSSLKVRCLMNVYAQRSDRFDNDFHSIIFVNQRKIACSLSELLIKISKLDQFSFIKASYVVGTNGSEDSMNQNKQKIELDKFRKREVNVLVATNVIEEGIDVPSCNMVIRFSRPNNFCSFIQSKGRARSNESIYYLIVEESEVEEFKTELRNFLEIENDIQNKLIKTRNEILDETIDDVEFINSLIPPLKNGNSELTCMKALELINRWVNTLQRESCCKLYPFYDFKEFKEDEIKNSSLYKCILWLPPNTIINKEIESGKFKRKKWAKMHAALLACKELDNAGQLTSNLLLITENEWIKPHIELDEDIREKFEKTEKIKKYQSEIMDEFKRNHPMANINLYLYKIDIQDSSNNLLDNSFELGYLSSKFINDVPEFRLYKSNTELSVKLTHVSSKIMLNNEEINLLRKANKSVFNDMLRFNCEFDFESSLYGGLIVILSPNGIFGDSQIDWDTIRSLKLDKENFNTYRKIYPEKHDILLRMNANKEKTENNVAKNQTNRLFMLFKVHDDMNPLSQFVNREAKNFKEYFFKKYQLETTDLEQPLIELKHVETSFNYVSKSQLASQNKVQSVKYKEIFIGEHFLVLPFEKKYLFAFSLIPAILHRINTLIKASHLKNLIENSISTNWNIKSKKVTSAWNSSLKFNKEVKPKKPDVSSDSDSESEDNQDIELCYRRDQDEEDDANETTTIPDLLIKDYSDQDELEFPSTYAILQCLTFKSARENFDLERYEILGDCFLKLVVVLRIYLKYGSTNEGNMALLKSLRVSNKYLFKLAQKKNLHHYVNSNFFQPRVNWILPNEIVNENDDRLNIKFNFKSLADSTEALIGCYLMHLGQKGGKECIRWLDLKVSNQDDMIDFNEDLPLPNPLLAPKLPDSINLIEFEKFAETLNYKFNNLVYLFQAFTHPSYLRNRYTASYQKLELIGDAVLDILVTQYIFADKKEYSPGELTNLRQSLVNNKFFAFLAVKHNFHNYMKYDSQAVYNSINEYVKMHETCPPDFSYLDRKAIFESLAQNDLDEYDIETPKFLADIFESVAGAIYLDSNCSLEAVWRVYYPIMKNYLIKFKKNPPVSPIVALNTLKPQVNFEILYNDQDGEIVAILKGDGKEFSAKAKTKSSAKLKVHKQAVRFYDPERKIIFF